MSQELNNLENEAFMQALMQMDALSNEELKKEITLLKEKYINTLKEEDRREYNERYLEIKLRNEATEKRIALGMTQSSISTLSGLSQQSVSRIENDFNTSPTLKSIIKYITALGLKIVLEEI